jgi:carbamoyltransferase
MPFAPVTLEEKADEYYVNWNKTHIAARFMTICYNCFPKLSKESPAVVHVDNTARPQIINKINNPLYYKILRSFYEETAIPTLINTSFNNHEEPIVCSPSDAIKSLIKGNVDYIIIENFIVSRR